MPWLQHPEAVSQNPEFLERCMGTERLLLDAVQSVDVLDYGLVAGPRVVSSADEIKLSFVCPQLAAKVRTLAEMMDVGSNEPLEVITAFRSWGTQQKLWDQGRSKPGPIVTNAKPGHSWHEYGLSADLCPISLRGTPGWSPDSPIWVDFGNKARSVGLFWGGDFIHVEPDRPHVQLTGKFPVSPNDEVRQIFLDRGMMEVWAEAGLLI